MMWSPYYSLDGSDGSVSGVPIRVHTDTTGRLANANREEVLKGRASRCPSAAPRHGCEDGRPRAHEVLSQHKPVANSASIGSEKVGADIPYTEILGGVRRALRKGVGQRPGKRYHPSEAALVAGLVARLLASRTYRFRAAKANPVAKADGSTRITCLPSTTDAAVLHAATWGLEDVWNRIDPAIEGGRPGRCAHDVINWVLKILRKRGKVVLFKFDLADAYGSTPFEPSIAALRKLTDRQDLVDLIERFGRLQHTRIPGVLQGTPCSGLLFSAFLHAAILPRLPNDGCFGMRMYCDDGAALFESRHAAEAYATRLNEVLAEFGMVVSPKAHKTFFADLDKDSAEPTRFAVLGFRFVGARTIPSEELERGLFDGVWERAMIPIREPEEPSSKFRNRERRWASPSNTIGAFVGSWSNYAIPKSTDTRYIKNINENIGEAFEGHEKEIPIIKRPRVGSSRTPTSKSSRTSRSKHRCNGRRNTCNYCGVPIKEHYRNSRCGSFPRSSSPSSLHSVQKSQDDRPDRAKQLNAKARKAPTGTPVSHGGFRRKGGSSTH